MAKGRKRIATPVNDDAPPTVFGGSASVKRQTVVETLNAPMLRGFEIEDFVSFQKRREKYEREVEEKKKEDGVSITLASYKTSVDPLLLWMLWKRGYIAKDAVENINDEDIKNCIQRRAVRSDDQIDLNVVENAIRNVHIKMNISDATSRIDTLVWDYFRALENVGLKQFPTKCPRIAIEHLFSRIKPTILYKMMEEQCKIRADEGLHKKDLFAFVKVLTEQAVIANKLADVSPGTASRGEVESKTGKGSDSHKNYQGKIWKRSRDKDAKRGSDSYKKESAHTDSKPHKKGKIKCLNPACGGDHPVRKCPNTSKEEADRLLTEFFEKKWSVKESKKMSKMGNDQIDNHSTLFSAKFCETVEALVMADPGSDDNLMPPSIFREVVSSNKKIQVENLKQPLTFAMAVKASGPDGNSVQVTCKKAVHADAELRIRHGSSLMLRNVRWVVSDQEADHVLLGRPLLEALGLNTKNILQAASERFDGIVNVPEILHSDTKPEGTIAKLLKDDGIFHRNSGMDEEHDDEDDEDIYIDLGENSEEELCVALEMRLQEAERAGISKDRLSELRDLVFEYKSIFRLRLGKSEPARVKSMQVKLKPDRRPVRAKARRYPKEQRDFLNKYTDALEDMGFIRRNPDAKWVAVPLLVAKPSSKGKFRMTIDLRPVNAATVKQVWPMPHIDSECTDFKGSTCFAVLDFVSGYWQMPMAQECQGLHSFVTPKAVYSPTRTLPGGTNTVFNFQSIISPLFSDLDKNIKVWLDDINAHADGEGKLLQVLRHVFEICRTKNLFLSARKIVLFTTEVKWCGRIISKDGIRLDPSRLAALKEISLPVNASELCEFVHCIRWMGAGIPDCAKRLAPLVAVLEEAHKKSGRRTKRSIKGIPLRSLSWCSEHEATFRSLLETLQNAVTLAYPKEEKVCCVYTDASNKYWSGVVTQTTPEMLEKPIEEQVHEQLAFCGAAFKGVELGWSTFEKEAFAIYQVFKKLDYLFYEGQETHVFTDHRNLLFVFCPDAIEPALGRHVVGKVQRWGLYLSRFQYVIEHIEGDRNIFADILTRWMKGYRREPHKLKESKHEPPSEEQYGKIAKLWHVGNIVPSTAEPGFMWPSVDSIREAQEKSSESKQGLTRGQDLLYRQDSCIWIPNDATELKLKILVISHGGIGGHRGRKATESILREEFRWSEMSQDVADFLKCCVHCLITRTGEIVPRPLGTALHGQIPNEVVHCDYLYMGIGIDGYKYVLLIRDDLSGFIWLWMTKVANSFETARALARWMSMYGAMEWLVSDQGSHFKNELMNDLSKEFRIEHHFTMAYSPWANGTVERCNREVLRACKALLSEWKLAPQDWPSVVEAAQSIINHSPLERLGQRQGTKGIYRKPLEVFTSIKPSRPLMRALPIKKYKKATTDSEIHARQLINIEETQSAMEELHKEVAEKLTAARAKQILKHNEKTTVLPANFEVGDFVLIRRAQKKGHKLHFLWKGPRRIVGVRSRMVFEVRDLMNEKTEVVHARRLLWYRAELENQQVGDELLAYAQHSEESYQDVKELLDIREDSDGFKIFVEWQGLPDQVDRTWEPLQQLHDDIPDMLKTFLASWKKKAAKEKASALLTKA